MNFKKINMRTVLYSIIAGCVLVSGCTKLEDPQLPVGIHNILTVEYLNNDSILIADSKDKIEMHVKLDSSNVAANMNVTFTTEQGSFIGATGDGKSITVRADAYDAKVILQSDNVVNDRVQIGVKVGEFMDYVSVRYDRSYPEEINVLPSKFILTADQSDRIYLTPDLRKAIGVVSKGTRVDFTIVNVTGDPDLYVQPVYWNETPLNRAELITTSSDTGSVKVITRVFDGANYITSSDTLNFSVE